MGRRGEATLSTTSASNSDTLLFITAQFFFLPISSTLKRSCSEGEIRLATCITRD